MTHLSRKQDWEKNFKALKVRGKEAEQLPRYSATVFLCFNNAFHQIIKVIIKWKYSFYVEIQTEFQMFFKFGRTF